MLWVEPASREIDLGPHPRHHPADGTKGRANCNTHDRSGDDIEDRLAENHIRRTTRAAANSAGSRAGYRTHQDRPGTLPGKVARHRQHYDGRDAREGEERDLRNP